jgi:hypothetical protein
MTVEVSTLPDKPVVLATLRGQITLDDARYIFQQTHELRQSMPDHIYRLTDVREATSSFSEIIQIIRSGADDLPSATNDPTITVVFVGKSQWSKLFIDAMRQQQFGQVTIPLFNTLDEALEFINDDIQSRSA